MTPDTIRTHFVADFPPPKARTAGNISEEMIEWIVKNWDSLNRKELTLFLAAAELLAGMETENVWLSDAAARTKVAESPAQILLSALGESQTPYDQADQAECEESIRPKWHELFPWNHPTGQRDSSRLTDI